MEQGILSATVPTGLDSVTEDEKRDAAPQLLYVIVFVTKHLFKFQSLPRLVFIRWHLPSILYILLSTLLSIPTNVNIEHVINDNSVMV